MKYVLVIALLFLGALETLPQGQIVFNNRINGVVVAPVFGPEVSSPELSKQGNTATGTPAGTQTYSGPLLQGSAYTAQLFAGATNTDTADLQPVTPATYFGINSGIGFVAPPDFAVTVAGIPAGTPAKMQLRVWDNDNGTLTNWNEVRTNSWVPRGSSLPFITPPLGGSVILPPNLEGLQSFNIAFPAGITASIPTRPTNLLVTTVSDTQNNLTWHDTSTNELGFRIHRSVDGLRFTAIASTAPGATSFASTNLYPNTRYYYRVRAFNDTAESSFSNTNFATTRTPFAHWQLSTFSSMQATNPAIAGAAANPDADALPNILEHALGRSPLQADSDHLVSASLDSVSGTNFLALTYSRSKAAVDVSFTARPSSNVVAWPSSSDVAGPILVSETPATVTEKFRVNASMDTASQQFLKLLARHTGVRDSWETNTPMPIALDEVACAVIGRRLYVVGGDSSATLAFDLDSQKWTNLNAPRPFPGNHHAAETLNGKLYLLGGIGGGSASRVQIYDPALNVWSLGANLIFPAGSSASAVINGEIYVAGGIIDGVTIDELSSYNPMSNTWTTNLASMPLARNHAASATDGSLLYVFGGRPPADGSDTVQIYNPATGRWTASSLIGSTLAPLPQIRGGMGKAVFFNGEFYVMGGETFTGFGATPERVYNRVDIYNPVSNSWREGAPMLTARHGIYPVLDGIRIYVAGGGVVAGASSSSILEVYIAP